MRAFLTSGSSVAQRGRPPTSRSRGLRRARRHKTDVVRLEEGALRGARRALRLDDEQEAGLRGSHSTAARARRCAREGRVRCQGRRRSSREFLDLREALNKKDKEILSLREQMSRKDKELLDARDSALVLEREKADQEDGKFALEERYRRNDGRGGARSQRERGRHQACGRARRRGVQGEARARRRRRWNSPRRALGASFRKDGARPRDSRTRPSSRRRRSPQPRKPRTAAWQRRRPKRPRSPNTRCKTRSRTPPSKRTWRRGLPSPRARPNSRVNTKRAFSSSSAPTTKSRRASKRTSTSSTNELSSVREKLASAEQAKRDADEQHAANTSTMRTDLEQRTEERDRLTQDLAARANGCRRWSATSRAPRPIFTDLRDRLARENGQERAGAPGDRGKSRFGSSAPRTRSR